MGAPEANARDVAAGESAGRPGTISLSVAAHPRAARRVRQAREAAGLIGFLLGGWMSLGTHTLLATILRALAAGVACQLIVWAAALLIWRHLIVAEVNDREHALLEAAGKAGGAGRGEQSGGDGRGGEQAVGTTRR